MVSLRLSPSGRWQPGIALGLSPSGNPHEILWHWAGEGGWWEVFGTDGESMALGLFTEGQLMTSSHGKKALASDMRAQLTQDSCQATVTSSPASPSCSAEHPYLVAPGRSPGSLLLGKAIQMPRLLPWPQPLPSRLGGCKVLTKCYASWVGVWGDNFSSVLLPLVPLT